MEIMEPMVIVMMIILEIMEAMEAEVLEEEVVQVAEQQVAVGNLHQAHQMEVTLVG